MTPTLFQVAVARLYSYALPLLGRILVYPGDAYRGIIAIASERVNYCKEDMQFLVVCSTEVNFCAPNYYL